MKLLALVATLFALTLVAAGCGESINEINRKSPANNTGKAYPTEVEDTFMKSCETSSKGQTEPCRKFLDCLEDRVTYNDFKKADRALTEGTEAPKSYRDAVEPCTEAMTS